MASTYSTWEYYQGIYRGKLSEQDYSRLAIEAAGEINQRTFGRAPTAPASMADGLRNCECRLVDVLFSHELSYQLLPSGIQSINNDGLSASAGSASSWEASREAVHSAEIRAVCQKWLLRPVNLLYPGVRRC